MKNLVFGVVVLLLIVAGVGYYRGWFSAGTSSNDSQTTVNVTADKNKIKSDLDSASKAAKELGVKTQEAAKGLVGAAKEKLSNVGKDETKAEPPKAPN